MIEHSVYFENIAGKNVCCYFSEPDPSQKKIVIMSHGFRGSSVGPARTFVDFARLLLSYGISVLRFDQPNSGNSDGQYLDSSFNEWVDTTTYFALYYLERSYQVALLGQSMGATTTVVASAREELRGKIACLLLWVPDPKTSFHQAAEVIYEEEGEKYKGTFWLEAKRANFFACLQTYERGIHLVYGEYDRYISESLRQQVIERVQEKGQSVMLLQGQDHSAWEYDLTQQVYQEELQVLQTAFS